LNGNPQLNDISHLSHRLHHLPRPIILDTHLRFSIGCNFSRIIMLELEGDLRWFLHLLQTKLSWKSGEPREQILRKPERGSLRFPLPNSGRIHIPSLPNPPHSMYPFTTGRKRSSSHQTFLTFTKPPHKSVDTIIITVAPVLVWGDGVGCSGDLIRSGVCSSVLFTCRWYS